MLKVRNLYTNCTLAFTSILLNFLSILHEKNLLFLVYTSTFTKHLHQFIYSTHLFNKIFIILLIFIIHSLTVPLSHRPTTTITTQPPSPHIPRSAPINPDLHASTPPPLHTYPDQPDQPRPIATITINNHQPSTRSTQTHIPRSTRSNHTQINPQPKSTQTKQTHTNQDRPTP